jgi:uncharacterized membrane protein
MKRLQPGRLLAVLGLIVLLLLVTILLVLQIVLGFTRLRMDFPLPLKYVGL